MTDHRLMSIIAVIPHVGGVMVLTLMVGVILGLPWLPKTKAMALRRQRLAVSSAGGSRH